jgi:hypothetical protein
MKVTLSHQVAPHVLHPVYLDLWKEAPVSAMEHIMAQVVLPIAP